MEDVGAIVAGRKVVYDEKYVEHLINKLAAGSDQSKLLSAKESARRLTSLFSGDPWRVRLVPRS